MRSRYWFLAFLACGVVGAATPFQLNQVALGMRAPTAGQVSPPAVILTNFGAYRGWSDSSYGASCLEYRAPTGNKQYAGAVGDGIYRIQVNGALVDVYCDMTSEGGGWTKVVQQYENTPVVWTGATSGNSFSLPAAKIPSHTHTAFGKDNQATFVDYVPLVYTTGDIVVGTSLISPKTGVAYTVNRRANAFYASHSPDWGTFYTSSTGEWRNTLTFEKLDGIASFNWAFSPYASATIERGYAMNEYLGATTETYAWTVWVR